MIYIEDINKKNKIDDLIKKAGDIDLSKMYTYGEIKIQWLRNKEAIPEQKFGNQEVIFNINNKNFEKYVLPSDKKNSIDLIKTQEIEAC